MGDFFGFSVRFFHGWRRRIGLVTLILALVFTGALVRSFQIEDKIGWEFRILGENETHYYVSSVYGRLTLKVIRNKNGKVGRFFCTGWQSLTAKDDEIGDDARVSDGKIFLRPEWRIRGLGFFIGGVLDPTDKYYQLEVWTVPYWSIVLPLTLVSMWLLLLKPRDSEPEKLVELITVQNA